MDNVTFYRRRLVELMQQTNMLREHETQVDYSETYLRARLMQGQTAYRRLLQTMFAWVSPGYHGVLLNELKANRAKLDELVEMAALVFGTDDVTLAAVHCNAGAVHYVLGDNKRAAEHYQRAIDIATLARPGDKALLLEPEEGLAYSNAANNPGWRSAALAAIAA